MLKSIEVRWGHVEVMLGWCWGVGLHWSRAEALLSLCWVIFRLCWRCVDVILSYIEVMLKVCWDDVGLCCGYCIQTKIFLSACCHLPSWFEEAKVGERTRHSLQRCCPTFERYILFPVHLCFWKYAKALFLTNHAKHLDLKKQGGFKGHTIPDKDAALPSRKALSQEICFLKHDFLCWNYLYDRRKFRSQTSDNMDRWKADQGRGREKRKIRRKKKKKEDADCAKR